jgi:protein-L-isoaspartate(D-aspartate) O-methyltransferase
MSGGSACDPDRAIQPLLTQIIGAARETGALTGCPELSARVLAALAAIPRHAFVPAAQRNWAYADRPLPIGHDQTISQPFMVALMTELLAVQADAVVLEIGTGSGYQAAVLARLVRRVYSMERIPALAAAAAQRLHTLGFTNVAIRCADGSQGWSEHAPFDGIMVTAAAAEVPPALVEQLKPGARLIIPVGAARHTQVLRVIHKDENGVAHRRDVLPVVFVPLIPDPE